MGYKFVSIGGLLFEQYQAHSHQGAHQYAHPGYLYGQHDFTDHACAPLRRSNQLNIMAKPNENPSFKGITANSNHHHLSRKSMISGSAIAN